VIETNAGLQNFQGLPPGIGGLNEKTIADKPYNIGIRSNLSGTFIRSPVPEPLRAKNLPYNTVFKAAPQNMGGCMGCHGVDHRGRRVHDRDREGHLGLVPVGVGRRARDRRLASREEVAQHLRGAEIRHGNHNVSHALERAVGLVEGSPAARIVLATDLQKSSWRRRKLQNARKVPVVVIDAGLEKPENAWIRSVKRRNDRIVVEISGADSMSNPEPAVRMLSEKDSAITGFPDGNRVTFRLPPREGESVFRFALVPGGDLSTDDTNGFVYRNEGSARVLLVNGSPHGFELRDELLFVRHALNAADPARGKIESREFRPGDLSAGIPDPLDLTILANVGALPSSAATALLSRVRSGMTLLMTGGDQWDSLISLESPPGPQARSLEPFFVAPLRDKVTLEQGNPLRPPFLRVDRTSLESPFHLFSQPENGDISGIRVWKYWLLNANPGAGIRVLLRHF